MNSPVIKLPLIFYGELLQQALVRVPEQAWTTHFKAMHYEGDWSSAPLIAVGGSSSDIRLTQGDFRPTPLLERCPYFQEVVASFRCPLRRVRLLRLAPGAFIREHVDHEGVDFGIARIHIPVQTNDKVVFVVAGRQIMMKPGECWFLDTSYPHRAANPSAVPRIHLVLDCEVNEFITSLLAIDLLKGRRRRVLGHRIRWYRFRVIDALRLVRLALRGPARFWRWLFAAR